jgi:hypothetical protein
MPDFTTIVLSGGSSVVLATTVGFLFKNLISERIKGSIQHEYNQKLEAIRTELEIAKLVILRYSDSQFNRYNELWFQLCNLKQAGEKLWDEATKKTLSHFANELERTELKVDQSFLLIEESHYQELKTLFAEFHQFQFGKKYLMEVRDRNVPNDEPNFTDAVISTTIRNNGETREKYSALLRNFGNELKIHIRGGKGF